MATRFIFDFGNARGKWYVPNDNKWGDFLHAVVQLSKNDWESIVGRGTPPKGIICVNGIPYAIGEAARRHVIKDRPHGAARYKRSYYLPALCFALSEAFKENRSITLYASHAPQDQGYAGDLIAAAQGIVSMQCQHGELSFDIKRVVPFDEPMGGYAHYAFMPNGIERPDNPIANKTVLMIDVGGYTADRMSVDPGGEVDILSIASTRAGTIEAIENFEQDLRRNNKDYFKDSGDLDIRRVEAAIISGKYQFGKISIDCKKEAAAAINTLVNDVVQVINSAGGAANFDVILLTGGGSALIYNALCKAFPNIDFVMVEPDRSLMKFANVFGGGKIAALLARINS